MNWSIVHSISSLPLLLLSNRKKIYFNPSNGTEWIKLNEKTILIFVRHQRRLWLIHKFIEYETWNYRQCLTHGILIMENLWRPCIREIYLRNKLGFAVQIEVIMMEMCLRFGFGLFLPPLLQWAFTRKSVLPLSMHRNCNQIWYNKIIHSYFGFIVDGGERGNFTTTIHIGWMVLWFTYIVKRIFVQQLFSRTYWIEWSPFGWFLIMRFETYKERNV